MDVFIAEEAELELRADALGPPGKGRRGLLLGHRRGPRYFVTRVFPLGDRSFPAAPLFRQLNRLFDGRIIGFYAMHNPDAGLRGILQPFAYGKVLLRIMRPGARSGRLTVRPSVIEFDNGFFLSPIALARRRP